jgi:molybdenum cofactor biosynthesis protein MoaC
MKKKKATAPKLTHFDGQGRAKMVDVSRKSDTLREAVVRGSISMNPATFERIMAGEISKGDVFAVARVAGIMAAKKNRRDYPHVPSPESLPCGSKLLSCCRPEPH